MFTWFLILFQKSEPSGSSGSFLYLPYKPWHNLILCQYKYCIFFLKAQCSHLCTLDLCDEASLLQLKPVGLVEFGPDEEVKVSDLVILSDQGGCETELTVGLHHHKHPPEHLSRDKLYLW